MTIAESLKAAGYYTAHIGKWHLGRENGMAAHDQGFDDSLLMQSGLYLPQDHPAVVNARLSFAPIDHFLWAGMGFSASYNSGNNNQFKPGGYLTDYWTDESIKVIKANRNRPFFLYLAHWGPHTPLQATRGDFEAVGDIRPHRKRVYAAMIRAVDRSVGRVLDTLEAAAGVPSLQGVVIDGVNLLPPATGEGAEDWDRDSLYWQNGHYQVVGHGDWKLQVNDRPTDGIKTWLFNLADDPTEQINLADSHPDWLAELSALLAPHQAGSRGPLYAPVINTPVLVDKTRAERFL